MTTKMSENGSSNNNKRPRGGGQKEELSEIDATTWPADITAHLVTFLPLQSLPSFASTCRAWNDSVARDGHWQVRYLDRWQQPNVKVSSWRTQYKNAHSIDGILYVCGLLGDPPTAPTHLHGADGQPVEADFYSTMSHRLRFTQATPGACHFLGVSDDRLYAWGSPHGLRGSGAGGQLYRVSMGILPRIGDPISIPTVVPSCCDGPHVNPLDRAGKIKQIHIATYCEQRCAMVTQCGDFYYFGSRSNLFDECPIPTSMMSILDLNLQRVRVASVALGDEHGILVDVVGRVFSFGDNDFGQLGLGNTDTVDRATLVHSLVEEGVIVVSVAAGKNHSLCLSSAGEVHAFGNNQSGQLGCGRNEDVHNEWDPFELEPTQVLISSSDSVDESVVLSGIMSVSAGLNMSAFLTSDGALYTCGQSNTGGLGTDPNFNYPQLVNDLASHHVTCISVGGGHMVALTADGLCFAWGNNDHGQCGREGSEDDNMRSGEDRGLHDDGRPNGLSVYDVAQVALPARVRFVCAGDTATFFILGEPLRETN